LHGTEIAEYEFRGDDFNIANGIDKVET